MDNFIQHKQTRPQLLQLLFICFFSDLLFFLYIKFYIERFQYCSGKIVEVSRENCAENVSEVIEKYDFNMENNEQLNTLSCIILLLSCILARRLSLNSFSLLAPNSRISVGSVPLPLLTSVPQPPPIRFTALKPSIHRYARCLHVN